jgi:hypothetical protein
MMRKLQDKRTATFPTGFGFIGGNELAAIKKQGE